MNESLKRVYNRNNRIIECRDQTLYLALTYMLISPSYSEKFRSFNGNQTLCIPENNHFSHFLVRAPEDNFYFYLYVYLFDSSLKYI